MKFIYARLDQQEKNKYHYLCPEPVAFAKGWCILCILSDGPVRLESSQFGSGSSQFGSGSSQFGSDSSQFEILKDFKNYLGS